MLFALLTVIAALQTQAGPETVQTVSAPTVSTSPTAATAPAAPTSAAGAPVAEAAPAEAQPEPEPEPEPEVEAPLPTRQVCRYVEVTGQRFPVRTCRTVTIYPDESH